MPDAPAGPAGDITITSDDIAAFDRDGAVCLRAVFDDDWVDLLQDGMDRCLTTQWPVRPGEAPNMAADGFYEHRHRWRDVPEYRSFIFDSPVAKIAAAFLRARKVNFLEDHTFHAYAGSPGQSPWHQDLPYYDLDGAMLSIWVPLQALDKDGSLKIVAGSHEWGKLFRPAGSSADDSPYEPAPDIDEGTSRVLSWDLDAGDAVVFSGLSLHAVTRKERGTLSRRFSSRWVGDAVFRKRAGRCSKGFEGLGMSEGAPIDSEWYPVVWRANEG